VIDVSAVRMLLLTVTSWLDRREREMLAYLMPWQPRFEIRCRRVVPATELLAHLSMEQGYEPIYRRALLEAALV
jgi:hypothetical protein